MSRRQLTITTTRDRDAGPAPDLVDRHFTAPGPDQLRGADEVEEARPGPGPYGDAIEATTGSGVAWLAPNRDLLGVEFDDVRWDSDDQTLAPPNGDTVTVRVRRGRVTVRVKHRRGGRAA